MDFLNAFLFALFCVATGVAVLYCIADWLAPVPEWRKIQPVGAGATRQPIQIAQLGAPCERDGVLITQMDRLRAAVTLADMLIMRGDLNGHRVSQMQIVSDADRFAQLQVSPDVTIEMLGRCDESLLQRYPHGYWTISAALVRESARRRRGTIAHPAITDPRAP